MIDIEKEALQTSDTARLLFLMKEIDGLVGVKADRYQYAAEVASEHGREEPTERDEVDGFRRMIDCAMSGGDE